MTSDTQPAPAAKAMLWTGWIMSALPSLVLLFAGTMKLVKSEDVVKNFEHLGYPEQLVLALGVVEVACTLVYLIPRTAVLGAILLNRLSGRRRRYPSDQDQLPRPVRGWSLKTLLAAAVWCSAGFGLAGTPHQPQDRPRAPRAGDRD